MEYTIHERQGRKVIEVDTKKAVYQGIGYKELSEFQKRKYENLVFFRTNERGMFTKIIYI